MNHPTRLLSSHASNRQEQAIARSASAAETVDRAIVSVWRWLLRLLRDQGGDPFAAQARALNVFTPLASLTAMTLRTRLSGLARWGWRSARAGIAQALPLAYLEVATRAGRWRTIPESRKIFEAPHVQPPRRSGSESEALAHDACSLPGNFGSQFSERRSSDHQPLLPLREDDGDPREALLGLLFPAPDEDAISRLMGPNWYRQLAQATRLATPETLAGIVGAGHAAGKTQQEIARDLLPAVDGFRVSARRIARTEGLRIAHVTQMACHEQLGDLVAGYTIRATRDSHTRPAHLARDGLTWQRDSGVPMTAALKMEADTLPDAYN